MVDDRDQGRTGGDRRKPFFSRTRLIMILLLAVAIPLFIGLAQQVIGENSGAIHQMFAR